MSIATSVKNLMLKLAYRHKSDEGSYIAWLRGKGVRVGRNVHLYSPWTIDIDTQRPWMIEIGDDVSITAHCSILQHDFSWAVIQKMTGEVVGAAGKVTIGNNVFIGQKTVILKGATIGDNVIVGAGSVVSGKLESNAVYGGVPARKIMDMDTFIEHRRAAQLKEAVECATEYRHVHGRWPEQTVMKEFMWLFAPRTEQSVIGGGRVFTHDGNMDSSRKAFMNSAPQFDSYEAFLQYAKGQEQQH
ncbi:acyltransferase [Bifidobacterium parmae]|uniref:Acetyltransferase (Cell wall biosynthesis) n=1 Tax=Bifidobacterium parmae TaxID=361854 RepID=A0A2N5J0H0_9BIFI|nr:acyltransferase [Bifidobacterium parmae]PLS27706.1 acetyltransferase (cell wall biosynthesis) [Bifidobacterium parmae]